MYLTPAIPRLEHLALKNIAINLTRHVHRFPKSKGKVRRSYGILQYLYSEDLLDVLQLILYKNQGTKMDYLLYYVGYYLFEGSGYFSSEMKPYFDFLFSKHTSSVTLSLGKKRSDTKANVQEFVRKEIPPKIFQVVLCRCKDLRSLTVQYCHFQEESFLAALPYWKIITGIDLLKTKNSNTVVREILKICSRLEVFKVSGLQITDESLWCICAEYDSEGSTVFPCSQSGRCCSVGKNLKHLTLYKTSVGKIGVARALQHFTELKTFSDSLENIRNESTIIPHGILFLTRRCLMELLPPVSLKLTSIYFDKRLNPEEIQNVLNRCPEIESLSFEFSIRNAHFFASVTEHHPNAIYCHKSSENGFLSPECQPFLDNKGDKLVSVTINDKYMRLVCLAHLLKKCVNLKELSLSDITVTYYRGKTDEVYLDATVFPRKIQKLTIKDIKSETNTVLQFFANLLSLVSRVRFLTMSGRIFQNSFASAIESNEFSELEEITILHAWANQNSVKRLLTMENSRIRKINLISCPFVDDFVLEYKNVFPKNHVEVSIDAWEYLEMWSETPFYRRLDQFY